MVLFNTSSLEPRTIGDSSWRFRWIGPLNLYFFSRNLSFPTRHCEYVKEAMWSEQRDSTRMLHFPNDGNICTRILTYIQGHLGMSQYLLFLERSLYLSCRFG